MLARLFIQNYAIIDMLDIDFSAGLNIITGETGAGKSILVGALNLILGERADSSVLQQDNKKCIVEGVFNIKSSQIDIFFTNNNLEQDQEITMRREISPTGKSRGFVNDTPVNLTQMRELATLLVDLHQQFDTLELSRADFQVMVLDALADNAELTVKMGEVYNKYASSKKELEKLTLIQSDAQKEQDYNQFLFNELEELNLVENELEGLDGQLHILTHAETVKQQLSSVYFELKDSDLPVVQQLKTLQHRLQQLQQYNPDISLLEQRIASAVIDLKDVADELETIEGAINYDAEQISIINERISLGYKLQKKHSVQTTNELIQIQKRLAEKLDAISSNHANIEALTAQVELYHKESMAIAAKISARRRKAIEPFNQKVNKLLQQVGMPNARIDVRMQEGSLASNGSDDLDFLFDANKSGRFEPLRKVASGGELSRLMLSIKSLVAEKLQLPTLIFDEIDSGISGEAARQVGLIMKNLSANHQLIAITHQPQIAAKADTHHFVYKEIKNEKLFTSIRLLQNEERITAIAKMLSGEKPTAAAMENAREMVLTSR